MKTYKLYLIRHAKTAGNLDGRYIGLTDESICETGRQELLDLLKSARYPGAMDFYSSPLLRCTESLSLLYPGKSVHCVGDLAEYHFGEFEGKNIAELNNRPDYHAWVASGFTDRPTGGEAGGDFGDRISRGFEYMVNDMMKRGVTDAVCVTHGGVIQNLMARYALPQLPPSEWACANGRGFALLLTPQLWMNGRVCEFMGDIPVSEKIK